MNEAVPEALRWLLEEGNWNKSSHPIDCLKLGEPTLCDPIPLDWHSCSRIGEFVRNATGLRAFSMSGFAIHDGNAWAQLRKGLGQNKSIHTLEWNQNTIGQISTSCHPTLLFPAALQNLTLIDCDLPESFQLSNLPPGLGQLRIIGCNVSIDILESAMRWQSLRGLDLLDLRGNHLDRERCIVLASILSKAPRLRKLILEDTRLTDDCLSLLFQRRLHVESLNLGENHLSDGNALMELIRSQPLKALTVQGNTLVFPVPELSPVTDIRKLNISSCHSNGNSFQFLSSMPNLVSLDMSSNAIDDIVISGIANMIHLQVLKLCCCGINNATITKLLSILSGTCRSIDLENNRISSVVPISKWMTRSAQHLEALRLAGNPIKDELSLWGAMDLHCWKLVDLTGVPMMRHWVLLNRAGRFHFPYLEQQALCEHLVDAERIYGLNALYYLVRHCPELCQQSSYRSSAEQSM